MERLEIHNRIGTLMEKENLTQDQMAQKLGISRECLKNWTSGTRNIKADDIIRIAQTFHVSAAWLLGLRPVDNPTDDIDAGAVCEATGLSNNAVEALGRWTHGGEFRIGGRAIALPVNEDEKKRVDVINALVEDPYGCMLLDAIGNYIFRECDAFKTGETVQVMEHGSEAFQLWPQQLPALFLADAQEKLVKLRDSIRKGSTQGRNRRNNQVEKSST